jgi:6-phosphogluconolactonase
VIYLGGYASGSDQGIGVAAMRDGVLTLESTVECAPHPSYLAVAPDGRALYAVHELDEGLISAFAIGEDGSLRSLGVQQGGGAHPCHLSVHPSGRYVLSANWGSGTIVVHPVERGGALGPATDVVENPRPHAHMVVTDPAGRWVLAVHLGAGTVSAYELNLESGTLQLLSEVALHRGAGPRHLAVDPLSTMVYVVNELDSTLTACRYDATSGRIEPRESVRTVPDDLAVENYPSAVRVSPDGRFVYVGNRGHDSIGVLSTGPSPRLLATYPSGGQFPRDMAFDEGGRLLWVANERADLVVGLAVDPADGGLVPTERGVKMPRPTCVLPVQHPCGDDSPLGER